MKQFLVKVPLRIAPLPQSPSHAHNPTVDAAPHAWLLGERCHVRNDSYVPRKVVGMAHDKWLGSFLAIVMGGVKNNPTNRFVTTFFFPSLIL